MTAKTFGVYNHKALICIIPVLFNIIVYSFSIFIFMDRAIFVVEYFILFAFAKFIKPLLLAALFAFLFFLDMVLSIAPGFYLKETGLRDTLSSLFDINASYLLAIVIMVISIFVISYFFFKKIPKHDTNNNFRNFTLPILILATAFFIIAADRVASPNEAKDEYESMVNVNISSIISRRVVLDFVFHKIGSPIPTAYNVPSATSRVFNFLRDEKELKHKAVNNIVLVVVESLTYFHEENANKLVWQGLNQEKIKENYNIIYGDVPHSGPTVAGELRELCQISIQTVAPKVDLLPIEDCLPNIAANWADRSIAFNGFSRHMFDAATWYSGIGFDTTYFIDDLMREYENVPTCGTTFHAICDEFMADRILREMRNHVDETKFIYWMTFQGHLPLKTIPENDFRLDCSLSQSSKVPQLCLSIETNNKVIEKIASIASSPEGRNSIYIIVGDHAPPFLSKSIRKHVIFDRVPYAILWPL